MTNIQAKMADQIRRGQGFIAALDQSGGSTPNALNLYGVPEDAYAGEDEMFDLIHEMRARIINAPAFDGSKVIGAILFEMTMDRQVNGKPTALALWEDKGVVPFLKIDKGLEAPSDGVKLMKPMPHLGDLLPRARAGGIFGTKMRAVIDEANEAGINAVVDQQFDVGAEVLSHGLVPILEPEITITMDNKAKAEAMLQDALLSRLDKMDDDIMLKLTLPDVAGQYQALVDHPRVMKVVALSGGYDRAEANARLAQNSGIVASFSRALTEGLSAQQSDDAFNATIADTIDSIHAASVA
ncbi:fructose bisphosphate aldolase [Pseudooctadecabacter jejudonensis]|nr:fructose bisphosphate aldolase [Pseudooctadecabacter jejudonensis]